MTNWKPALALLATTSVLLAACSSNEDDKAEVSSDPSELKGQTITVGSWKGTEAEVTTWDKMLKDFTKQTGIKVKKKIYNDYQTQLQTDLVGGTAPDVFYVDAFLSPELSKQGVLAPLDDYMKQTKDFKKEDYYAPAYKAFTAEDGKQYGLPKDYSTLGVYYNEALLKEAGVSPDDIPTKSEEWPTFLSELKDKLPKGVSPAITTSEMARHLFVMEASGTDITDEKGYAVLSDPAQIKQLQPIVDAYKKGLIRRPADLGQGWAGDSFGAQKAALMIEGNWAVAHLKQNFKDVKFGTKETPTINDKKGSMMFTVSYSMNAQTKFKAASWEFIKYAAGNEGMKIWADGAGTLPSLQSVADEMKLEDDPIKAPFVKAGAYATPWQKGDTLSIIAREYNNQFPAALKGEVSLEDAMKKAEKTANKDIKTQLNK